MNKLDVNLINIFSSYRVWEESNRFYFETDYDLKYFVDFSLEDNPQFNAYWFNLVNMSGAASPKDMKIWQTVFCIIEEFLVRILTFFFIFVAQTEDSRLKGLGYSLIGLTKQDNKNAISLKQLKSRERILKLKNMLL